MFGVWKDCGGACASSTNCTSDISAVGSVHV
jgi:hypothetical protein